MSKYHALAIARRAEKAGIRCHFYKECLLDYGVIISPRGWLVSIWREASLMFRTFGNHREAKDFMEAVVREKEGRDS